MKQAQTILTVATKGAGLYEFTGEVAAWVAAQGILSGLLTLFCRHTSASLTIQENADPDVVQDLQEWFRRSVPEGAAWMRHITEGADDMPAHIKSVLTDVSLSIPVIEGRMVLGSWQGIYLFEHRKAAHRRQIVLHLLGT
ncbi:MAG: YjbQ family protein [Alphaproteobacteria bacterium]|nr:YjbQ family protein [Alphaproteobacteria bacterium]